VREGGLCGPNDPEIADSCLIVILYEIQTVIAANWSRERLEYMTLIANRFGDYVDSTTSPSQISCMS
jgi:hypothetical protein